MAATSSRSQNSRAAPCPPAACVTWSTTARTSTCAFALAQANPARCSSGRSGQSSPIAAASVQSMPSASSRACAAASLSPTPKAACGRPRSAARRRTADLGLPHAAFGVGDKLAAAQARLDALGIDWTDAAAIGDDWPDLPLLQRAGFACASANAHVEVRAVVDHVTQAAGGHGAAREFCDLLLVAAGRYAGLLESQRRTLDAR